MSRVTYLIDIALRETKAGIYDTKRIYSTAEGTAQDAVDDARRIFPGWYVFRVSKCVHDWT